jgi:hypothetical protein
VTAWSMLFAADRAGMPQRGWIRRASHLLYSRAPPNTTQPGLPTGCAWRSLVNGLGACSLVGHALSLRP